MTEVLELHQAQGALEHLEAWLAERGFFVPGGEKLEAALYLGYGLSETLRRTSAPPPPEPCALPLVACRVRDAAAVRPSRYVGYDDNSDVEVPPAHAGVAADVDGSPFHVGGWRRTWLSSAYASAVEAVRAAIARGDVYQVNLVQHLSAAFAGDAGALAARLRRLTPHNRERAPMFFRGNGWAVALGVAGALPRASRAQGLDDADQGHTASRARARSSASRRRTPPST